MHGEFEVVQAAPMWVILVVAYLLGSTPVAYLVTRLVRGADIRDLGDGNMGAKNTVQCVGWGPGLIVLALDVAKGSGAVLLAQAVDAPDRIVLAAGACAVRGHDFPIFLGFRGGQGLATAVGALLVLCPLETATAVTVLLLVAALSRKWKTACFTGFGCLVLLLWFRGHPLTLVFYTLALVLTFPLVPRLREFRSLRRARLDADAAALADVE